MADPIEQVKIDVPEKYTQESGVVVPPEKFRPFNATKSKLSELRADISGTRDQDEKMKKALAFMEANQVTPSN